MSKNQQKALQNVKGMDDILPGEIRPWQEIERKFREVFESWNFKEIRTPLVEPLELFKRSIGSDTDIVAKEMFAFKDRKDRDLALRPEATASVVRSFIQHRLGEGIKNLGLYYWGSMYRAERPQKGRKREFYQAGCELFGESHPYQDIVLITALKKFLKEIGLQQYELKINHLGTPEERAKYIKELQKYLKTHEEKLSADSKRRLETNPLRVFDSKLKEDLEVTAGAPKLIDSLGEASREQFEMIQEKLKKMKIDFVVEPRIVRGLDYYTGFVFEVTHPALGAQDAIGAGGRYDGLVEMLGGPQVGASGFALGIERLLLSLKGEGKDWSDANHSIYFGALSKEYFDTLHELRVKVAALGFETEADYLQTALKKHLSQANKIKASFTVILGEAEIGKQVVLLKDMASGEQKEVPFSKLEETLKTIRS